MFSIYFYGVRAKELRKKWEKLLEKTRAENLKERQEAKDKKINELNEKLGKTEPTFWNRERKAIEKAIEKETKKEVTGHVGDRQQRWISYDFLSSLGAVKISTGDKSTIYQV